MNFTTGLIEAHIFRIKDEEMQFLLLKRSPSEKLYPNIWQMVTGKIKSGEKAFDTALREIKEETGLRPIMLWSVPNVNMFYDGNSDSIIYIPVFAAQVNANEGVHLSEEHFKYAWMNEREAEDNLIWPGQKKSVKIISEYFKNHIEEFNLLRII